eukprot:scaffold4687_cov117-Isochrysis_galbana.AAC.6
MVRCSGARLAASAEVGVSRSSSLCSGSGESGRHIVNPADDWRRRKVRFGLAGTEKSGDVTPASTKGA